MSWCRDVFLGWNLLAVISGMILHICELLHASPRLCKCGNFGSSVNILCFMILVENTAIKPLLKNLKLLFKFYFSLIVATVMAAEVSFPDVRFIIIRSILTDMIIILGKTERIFSQVQAAEMGFLQRFHGVTLRKKVRTCEIHKTLNTEPFIIRIERSQLRCFGLVSGMPTNDWRGKSCWQT